RVVPGVREELGPALARHRVPELLELVDRARRPALVHRVAALVEERVEVLEAAARLHADPDVARHADREARGPRLLLRVRRVVDDDRVARRRPVLEADPAQELAERGQHELLREEALEVRRAAEAAYVRAAELLERDPGAL